MAIKEASLNIDEVPPWYIALITGFQHYLLMFVSTFTTPFFYASAMCIDINSSDMSDIVNTMFFVFSITTILQATCGVRLPIIQGTAVAFLLPVLSLLRQPEWRCPQAEVHLNTSLLEATINSSTVNTTAINNNQQPPTAINNEMWKQRMREISGDIMVASVLQILIGASGLMNIMLRYIGPITIAPIITVIGLSLLSVVAEMCSLQWAISTLTVVLITIFSQIKWQVVIPYSQFSTRISRKKILMEDEQTRTIHLWRIPIFSVLSLILSILVVWALCYILTITGIFADSAERFGYHARTDLRTNSFKTTKWFRIPYPFQFGRPTVSPSGVIGMTTAVIASIMESIGDYYVCADVSGAPPPPKHAINRGIMVEGLGSLLCGMFGTGLGCTSYSQNIAILSVTKVRCRVVVQICAVFALIMSILGKFAALFVTIPLPVIGGMFMVCFAMITAVGLSNLQQVNLRSTRNLFVLGLSIFVGLSVPEFLSRHQQCIQTGNAIIDSVITTLLSNCIFVSGVIAFSLDNIIPGTCAERGMLFATNRFDETGDVIKTDISTYDIPHSNRLMTSWTRYLPFCPKNGAKTSVTSRITMIDDNATSV